MDSLTIKQSNDTLTNFRLTGETLFIREVGDYHVMTLDKSSALEIADFIQNYYKENVANRTLDQLKQDKAHGY